jgi:hypothetical protein
MKIRKKGGNNLQSLPSTGRSGAPIDPQTDGREFGRSPLGWAHIPMRASQVHKHCFRHSKIKGVVGVGRDSQTNRYMCTEHEDCIGIDTQGARALHKPTLGK